MFLLERGLLDDPANQLPAVGKWGEFRSGEPKRRDEMIDS
jgi:hypothetical protein